MVSPLTVQPRFSSLHVFQHSGKLDPSQPAQVTLMHLSNTAYDEDGVYFNLKKIGQSDAVGQLTQELHGDLEAQERQQEMDADRSPFRVKTYLSRLIGFPTPGVELGSVYEERANQQFLDRHPNIKQELMDATAQANVPDAQQHEALNAVVGKVLTAADTESERSFIQLDWHHPDIRY